METFFLVVVVLSSFVSGAILYFFKNNRTTYFSAFLVPLLMILSYIFLNKDEFGYWSLLVAFGVCCSLMGSTVGIFAIKQMTSKSA